DRAKRVRVVVDASGRRRRLLCRVRKRNPPRRRRAAGEQRAKEEHGEPPHGDTANRTAILAQPRSSVGRLPRYIGRRDEWLAATLVRQDNYQRAPSWRFRRLLRSLCRPQAASYG